VNREEGNWPHVYKSGVCRRHLLLRETARSSLPHKHSTFNLRRVCDVRVLLRMIKPFHFKLDNQTQD